MGHQTRSILWLVMGVLQFLGSSLHGAHYTKPSPSLERNIFKKNLLPEDSHRKISVALLLPLSGPKATIGEALKDAAVLALFNPETSSSLTLYPYDTATLSDHLEELHSLNPDVILGPVFASDTKSFLANAPKGSLVFSLSNDPSLLERSAFIMGFSPYEEASRLLTFAFKKGLKRIVVLLPDTPLGHELDTLTKAFSKAKNVQRMVIFYSLTEDLSLEKVQQWAKQMNAFHPTAVFIPDGSPVSHRLLATLKFKDFHYRGVHFLGSSQWDYPVVFSDASLKGLWITSHRSKKFQEFETHFQETYHTTPSLLEGLAYDIILLISAYQKEKAPFSFEGMIQWKGGKTLQGPLSFQKDGSVRRPWAIVEHTGRGRKIIG